MPEPSGLAARVGFQVVQAFQSGLGKQGVGVEKQQPFPGRQLGPGVHLCRSTLGRGDRPQPRTGLEQVPGSVRATTVHRDDLPVTLEAEQTAEGGG